MRRGPSGSAAAGATSGGEGGAPNGGTAGTAAGGADGGNGADDTGGGNGGTDGPSGGTSSGEAGATTGGTGSPGGGTSGGGTGGSPTSFPVTGILDDFNRDTGLGEQWQGAREYYEIVGERLQCTACRYFAALLWSEPFASNQEVYATLSTFDSDTAEVSLILLAQREDCDHVQVSYSPVGENVTLWACENEDLRQLFFDYRTLSVGDRLGARVLPGNEIRIFVNEQEVASVNASSFGFTSGRIGVVAHVTATMPIAWDDFGGGEY